MYIRPADTPPTNAPPLTQTRARMEQMQQAMQNPEVQRQMQEMAAFMSNQSVMQRIAELREDPELGPMFEEIKSGGMPALMKFMNDPKVGGFLYCVDVLMLRIPMLLLVLLLFCCNTCIRSIHTQHTIYTHTTYDVYTHDIHTHNTHTHPTHTHTHPHDQQVLAKIGEKLGDLPNTVAAQAGASGPSVMPAEPEINNLLDAARYVCRELFL